MDKKRITVDLGPQEQDAIQKAMVFIAKQVPDVNCTQAVRWLLRRGAETIAKGLKQ